MNESKTETSRKEPKLV